MKIGDLEVEKSIISLEHDVMVLQKAFDYIIRNNRNIISPSQADIERFKDEAIQSLQIKYPQMGIRKQP